MNLAHQGWVYRVGAAYDFHAGALAIAPAVNYDLVDSRDDVVVYGLSFIYPFWRISNVYFST